MARMTLVKFIKILAVLFVLGLCVFDGYLFAGKFGNIEAKGQKISDLFK